MRAEQYMRNRPEKQSLLDDDEQLEAAQGYGAAAGKGEGFAKGRRLSDNRIEMGAAGSRAGSNGVEPNLCAELRSLCPLFILIFVEVGALGLPIAILPIITTTEFAQIQYDAPLDLYFLHEGGGCVEGSWSPPTAAQVADNNGGEPVEAPACTDIQVDPANPDLTRLIPGSQATTPCCALMEGSHLSYPVDSCPTGLDGFSDEIANNFYYPWLTECTNGNGWAAGAIAYSDAAKNVLTFFAAGAIGATWSLSSPIVTHTSLFGLTPG